MFLARNQRPQTPPRRNFSSRFELRRWPRRFYSARERREGGQYVERRIMRRRFSMGVRATRVAVRIVVKHPLEPFDSRLFLVHASSVFRPARIDRSIVAACRDRTTIAAISLQRRNAAFFVIFVRSTRFPRTRFHRAVYQETLRNLRVPSYIYIAQYPGSFRSRESFPFR